MAADPKSPGLTPDIPEGYRNGWNAARRAFGNRVGFFAPSLKQYTTAEFLQQCSCSFVPLSLTGASCELRCDHCRGKILEWMTPAQTPEDLLSTADGLRMRGARGVLISGGSDRNGVVPLKEHLGAIKRLREDSGLRVIVHTGMTDRDLARGLAEAGVEAALMDFIGSDDTISEVCHLDLKVTDYERSLSNLIEAGVPVSPHVVIGLYYGSIRGERRALELLSGYQLKSLVLVGLLPLAGTPMAKTDPPKPRRFGEIFLASRELLPDTPILLGCERPAGEHKLVTDSLALMAGLNGIAYPAEGIISLAKELGLDPELSESCCAIGADIVSHPGMEEAEDGF